MERLQESKQGVEGAVLERTRENVEGERRKVLEKMVTREWLVGVRASRVSR